MQKATLNQCEDDGTTERVAEAATQKTLPHRTVRSVSMPRPTTAIEAYTRRSLTDGDSEFAHYLLKFLRDFSAVSRRAAESSSLGRALLASSTGRLVPPVGGPGLHPSPSGAGQHPSPSGAGSARSGPAGQPAPARPGHNEQAGPAQAKDTTFRVPPFAASLAQDSSTMTGGFENDGGPANAAKSGPNAVRDGRARPAKLPSRNGRGRPRPPAAR